MDSSKVISKDEVVITRLMPERISRAELLRRKDMLEAKLAEITTLLSDMDNYKEA